MSTYTTIPKPWSDQFNQCMQVHNAVQIAEHEAQGDVTIFFFCYQKLRYETIPSTENMFNDVKAVWEELQDYIKIAEQANMQINRICAFLNPRHPETLPYQKYMVTEEQLHNLKEAAHKVQKLLNNIAKIFKTEKNCVSAPA